MGLAALGLPFHFLEGLLASKTAIGVTAFVGGFIVSAIMAWLNSLLSYRRDNIKELKEITKELVNIWSEMAESAKEIAKFQLWLKDNGSNPVFANMLPVWAHAAYEERLKLIRNYERSQKAIGQLYLYFDGYFLQNKLDDLFLSLRDTEWEKQSWNVSYRLLGRIQNKGTALLFEVKREINALSTLMPRPIRWIVVRINYMILESYGQRRTIRIVSKRLIRQLKNRTDRFLRGT